MTLKVYCNIGKQQAEPTGGIGQVILALYKHLHEYDIQLVNQPGDFVDVYATHVMKGNIPRVDVVHSHGLYFSDIPHLPYKSWHHNANLDIVGSMREAAVITVPSRWVAMPFQRDMRINPVVIGHGVDVEDWKHAGSHKKYILYNKNRESDVCQSLPAWELANSGLNVISTWKPVDKPNIPSLRVFGNLPHDKMKPLIQGAGVYLATTLETFGIGTIEALAAGVPVLGYRWGGTEDIITHGVNGYLVEPGDIAGLINGYKHIDENWHAMSEAAVETAKLYDWKNIVKQYADLYYNVKTFVDKEPGEGASIIITNYNYSKWVPLAIRSALNQEMPPKEVIIVDDGSLDNSREVIDRVVGEYSGNITIKKIYQENRGVSFARDRGISEASSPFVTCLDADDMIHPKFVKTLLTELKKDRSLGIAYSGLQFINGDNSLGAVSSWPPEFNYDIQASVTNPPANVIPSGCMFRKSMWVRAGGYRQEYAPGEDAEFWARGLSCGFDGKKATKTPLFLYRSHDQGASKTRKYRKIDDKMPWMRDGIIPMAAPSKRAREIRSYLIPDISVIIPVGQGHERYAKFAIESVLGQTLRSWELILVNDTNIEEQEFAQSFSRFPFLKIVHTPVKDGKRQNGAGIARNMGIDVAKGKAVFFLDADDLLTYDALEKHWTALVASEFNRYIYGGHMLVRDDGLEDHVPEDYQQGEWRMQHSTSVLMPTEWAKELHFDEELPSWEDWDFFLRAAIHGLCGYRVDGVYLVYRLDSGERRKLLLLPDGDINPRGKAIMALLRNRYDRYYNGEKQMAGCCGGTRIADEIVRAKSIINRTNLGVTMAMTDKGVGQIRLEYIGTNFGAIGFKAPSGRLYQGGLNSRHRFTDAPPQDAEFLVRSSKWRAVETLPPAQSPEVEERKAMTEQEVRDAAAKNLEAAKRDFELNEGIITTLDDISPEEIRKQVEAENALMARINGEIEPSESVDEFLNSIIREKVEETAQEKADINEATIEALMRIPGVSEKTAEIILDGQPYLDMKELLKISGIGESKLSAIENAFEVRL